MKLSDFLKLSDGTTTVAEAYDSPTTLVNLLVANIFLIAGVVIFFLIIGAGYSYLQNTSKGTEEAKNLAQGAVIGFIVMFAAYWDCAVSGSCNWRKHSYLDTILTMIKRLVKHYQQQKFVLSLFVWSLLVNTLALAFPSLTQAAVPFSGEISPPPGVAKYQNDLANPDQSGLINFLSNLIQIATIVAGIWTMINFILAGWIYITSGGDSSAHEKVSSKMINSVMGLVIIALAYTIAGILGYLIFGNAGYILNPQVESIL